MKNPDAFEGELSRMETALGLKSENLGSAENTDRRERPVILVVDDDPRVLETLAEILGPRYRVKTYSGGEDLRARWPGEGEAEGDAAILDIKMPKEDGLSVFHELRRLAPKMPILFYTAYPGNEEVVERARALGPAAFLGKGCSLHDLHEALHAVIHTDAETHRT